MTRYTFTILEEHRAALEKSILRDEKEFGALLLCGRARQIDPWSGRLEERFLCQKFIEVDESAFIERTPTKMTWSTAPFYRALKMAEARELAIAVVHSHPSGPLIFSRDDDIADRETFEIAFNRLDSLRPHLSVVMDKSGRLIARAYEADLKAREVEVIRTIGCQWRFDFSDLSFEALGKELDRQVRAFGAQSTQNMARLRIGIAGCGGTGSAVALLLARIGVRHLVLFDNDHVDETNLNRLHFSTRADANLGRPKVDVVAEGVAGLGLPISIKRFPYPVDDARSHEALKACDIIFGCTDDHLGRNFLNRFAHFYFVPVIDVGLLIEPRDEGGYESFDGRVTIVAPGSPCQVCRGLIKPELMYAEAMRREDPILYQERRRAGYIPDAPDPSPVVVTFTTELGSMAVNELFQRLNTFRGQQYYSERVRRFDEVKDADMVPAGRSLPHCKLCGRRTYDGRGDMIPFLDIT